jgi:hypothetical protein
MRPPVVCVTTHLLQVRAVFARHNLLDDFDSWSDISVWHKIRVPPTIFFYDGGAVVSTRNTAHCVQSIPVLLWYQMTTRLLHVKCMWGCVFGARCEVSVGA